ncbi:hypothetical protein [Candidatus Symbiothrix dinenymphae]|uniref:hypothetical protein n=1 Tax=Candidatus Symbiothrix dinenymphae TaxID=467085 RepID=UPI000ADF7191|nr:hypothetical protein [Candidatus Symbiothrix dinenymphae]
MKTYQDIPADKPQMVSDVAVAAYEVAYEVAQPQPYLTVAHEFIIPRDKYGKPIGHTLDEVFDAIDLDWSETSGIDFMKLSRMARSGEVDMDEMTDERLHSPEFRYEPYPGFKPKPRKKVELAPEWLAAMERVFEDEKL